MRELRIYWDLDVEKIPYAKVLGESLSKYIDLIDQVLQSLLLLDKNRNDREAPGVAMRIELSNKSLSEATKNGMIWLNIAAHEQTEPPPSAPSYVEMLLSDPNEEGGTNPPGEFLGWVTFEPYPCIVGDDSDSREYWRPHISFPVPDMAGR